MQSSSIIKTTIVLCCFLWLLSTNVLLLVSAKPASPPASPPNSPLHSTELEHSSSTKSDSSFIASYGSSSDNESIDAEESGLALIVQLQQAFRCHREEQYEQQHDEEEQQEGSSKETKLLTMERAKICGVLNKVAERFDFLMFGLETPLEEGVVREELNAVISVNVKEAIVEFIEEEKEVLAHRLMELGAKSSVARIQAKVRQLTKNGMEKTTVLNIYTELVNTVHALAIIENKCGVTNKVKLSELQYKSILLVELLEQQKPIHGWARRIGHKLMKLAINMVKCPFRAAKSFLRNVKLAKKH